MNARDRDQVFAERECRGGIGEHGHEADDRIVLWAAVIAAAIAAGMMFAGIE